MKFLRIQDWKLATKMNLMVGALIVAISVILILVAQSQIKQGMRELYIERNDIVAEFSLDYIEKYAPGEWSIRNGELYKGEKKVNGGTTVVDLVSKVSKVAATIFQGDTRVSTSIIEGGERAVGTKADKDIATVVLQDGETYVGEADILGEPYMAHYEPIKDGAGQIIGMWLIATPISVINEQVQKTVNILLVAVVIAVLVSIVAMVWFSRNITKRLKIVGQALEKAGNGDFSISSVDNMRTSKDEVGLLAESFLSMRSSLKVLINKVRSATEQVAAASQQISASTEEIASGSSDQANAAQTVSELFTELSIAIETVAQSAGESAELSNQTVMIARDGNNVVKDSIGSMTTVTNQMSRLEEDSNQIGDIIEVIDDIAEQTNLLALNAAIEAARAGEQGRGFAVVADEVRKLAERSGDATKQITGIIKGMQHNTGLSVKSVTQAVEKTAQISEAFERIVGMINESSAKAAEIAAASEEQSAQSREVLRSIETISAASEEAAAASEETAATTQSLARLADDLNQSVAVFKVE